MFIKHLTFQKNTTHDKGKITAQADPPTCHVNGTSEVERIIIPAIIIMDIDMGNQNLLAIFGISLKKFDL
jgi:hypothetical protein